MDVNSIIEHFSYFGIVLILTLCGTGLPIPEEVPVLAAAVLSHPVVGGAVMKWYLAFPACFLGALCGDCVMYAAGYHWGHNVLRNHRWFVRFQRPQQEPRIEELLQRHGLKVLFVARFLVGFRSPIYLAAGILRIPFRQFLFYDALAAVPVIGITFTLGYLFASQLDQLRQGINTVKYLLVVVVLLLVLLVLGYWYFKRHYFTNSERPDDPIEEKVGVTQDDSQ